jgi:serine/threonine-protein kinase
LSSSALALCLALGPRAARADEATDKAAAEALYELGHRLMDQGKYGDACPKLEASQDLDPGVGTLLLLGDCDEKLGKLASAWGAFQEASSLAKSRSDSERAGVADLRASALKPRLNYLTFDVPAAAAVDGFELRRAGKVVGKGAWGVSLPTDAGSYEVTATAPGRETWRSTINVPSDPSEPLVVPVPVLHEPTRAVAPASPADTSTPLPPAPERASSSSSQKTIGLVTAGVGVAGGVVGGVLTYFAWKKNNDSKGPGHCETRPNECSPTGVSERNSAIKFANAASYVGIGAAVVFATGTVLYLTAPSGDHGKMADFGLSLSSTF